MQPFEHAWQLLKSYSPFSHLRPGTEGYSPHAHRDLAEATEYTRPPLRGGPFYQRMARPTPPPENYAHRTGQIPASSEEYMEELKQGNSE